MGWLIAGTDPIACELICCGLIGLSPDRSPSSARPEQIGFGCSDPDQIEIVGDALPATPCPDFVMPQLMPVKFSFVHICRSLAKQLLLLARGTRIAENKGVVDNQT